MSEFAATLTIAPDPGLPARERLVQAAHALFYRDGIRATGIDRVIAEAGVTKVTFYRHFPSKNDLVCAYLEDRHARWMQAFAASLQRHGAAQRGVAALAPALADWLGDADFRGCAFINGVTELGGSVPAVLALAQQHKQALTDLLETLLPGPPGPQRQADAQALLLAVEGAIVRAQFGEPVAAVQRSLERLAQPWTAVA